jgi:hypothetical protein
MKVGDLVIWPQGCCDTPGLILDIKPAKGIKNVTLAMNPTGMVVLAMLPELENSPEWFHECELEDVHESR